MVVPYERGPDIDLVNGILCILVINSWNAIYHFNFWRPRLIMENIILYLKNN